MHESLKLFDEVLEYKQFKDTDIILFLNKADVFNQKLKDNASIRTAFPDYRGPDTLKESYNYVRSQFRSKNKSDRQIYVHMTTATNTALVDTIFTDVQTTIVNNSLRRAGLLA
eukprot:TRINITY_DN1288_c0_g1_i1.p1 TRINITY_DN1288_c0_g1~~TRINITY_DN1288_c0_g1_i1.p1  ORF type:complete len:113 (+),score=12.42 TRINITY_DN1288_c0_g1_i1:207-545(+)